jgi:hypothetical protein
MKMITWWMAGLVGATIAWFVYKQRAFSEAAQPGATSPGSDTMIGSARQGWMQ